MVSERYDAEKNGKRIHANVGRNVHSVNIEEVKLTNGSSKDCVLSNILVSE